MAQPELPSNNEIQIQYRPGSLWSSLFLLLMLVLLCLSIEQLGSFFITEESYHWFQLLNKPIWTLPTFIFPFVWTLLYLLMAFATWRVLVQRRPKYKRALLFWMIQLFLNAAWTPFFFAQQQIFYALILIYGLWLFVLLTTIVFYKQSKLAFIFMIPNLLWVSYMVVLNFAIWQMNN